MRGLWPLDLHAPLPVARAVCREHGGGGLMKRSNEGDPVETSLTDAEREELSRKNAEQNKRSEGNRR